MPDFTIGVDATWMPEFSSRVSINHHQFANLDKGNNSRYGWRIEVPFTYTLPTCLFDFMSCTELEVCIAPFYQQFYYGHVDRLVYLELLHHQLFLAHAKTSGC